MKSRFKGKVPRTSGWETQTDFDNLLADLDISSLCFLNDDYKHRITEFCYIHDVNKSKHHKEYLQLLQRKKMLSQELGNRWRDINASQSYSGDGEYFDSKTGLVIDKHNTIKYGISYNEEEDGYVYHYLDLEISVTEVQPERIDTSDEDDYKGVRVIPIKVDNKLTGYQVIDSERSKEEIYRNWDYTQELDEIQE